MSPGMSPNEAGDCNDADTCRHDSHRMDRTLLTERLFGQFM